MSPPLASPGKTSGAMHWRARADRLLAGGNRQAAAQAYERYLALPIEDPALIRAGEALRLGQVKQAEAQLQAYIRQFPNDPQAIRMFGRLGFRLEEYAQAERILRRCLELVPGYAPVRYDLVSALLHQGKAVEALLELDSLLRRDPRNRQYRFTQARAITKLGKYDEAATMYAGLLAEQEDGELWLSYGHVLRTVGKGEEAIGACRRAIALSSSMGKAWWDLANLKTGALGEHDIVEMRQLLSRNDLPPNDRFHIEFALAKALEEGGDFAASFTEYLRANADRRALIRYEPRKSSEQIERTTALFTPLFLTKRGGCGSTAHDPIFILGMHRSGSTLVEQILAAHPAVEGTSELPHLPIIARDLLRTRQDRYPNVLADLPPDRLRALGDEYLERTRAQRKTDRPFFVDKQPTNWFHIGLIHLILPNAQIIDTRRDPLSCCLALFRQHFARGAGFSYSVDEIATYYRDYAKLMAHFDRVLPRRIHRVQFEALIDDTEAEIRRLLDYLGLPFEPACLRFWELDRPVNTPSAEQVRRPINRDGIDAVANFAPFLGPLREALGDLVG